MNFNFFYCLNSNEKVSYVVEDSNNIYIKENSGSFLGIFKKENKHKIKRIFLKGKISRKSFIEEIEKAKQDGIYIVEIIFEDANCPENVEEMKKNSSKILSKIKKSISENELNIDHFKKELKSLSFFTNFQDEEQISEDKNLELQMEKEEEKKLEKSLEEYADYFAGLKDDPNGIIFLLNDLDLFEINNIQIKFNSPILKDELKSLPFLSKTYLERIIFQEENSWNFENDEKYSTPLSEKNIFNICTYANRINELIAEYFVKENIIFDNMNFERTLVIDDSKNILHPENVKELSKNLSRLKYKYIVFFEQKLTSNFLKEMFTAIRKKTNYNNLSFNEEGFLIFNKKNNIFFKDCEGLSQEEITELFREIFHYYIFRFYESENSPLNKYKKSNKNKKIITSVQFIKK